ncbi:MAG: 50S ribosomal protein L9 [Lachnospiraceae bacterium]|nr:50S ribosomal protein L9 [Lachnospiraceae bacterium]
MDVILLQDVKSLGKKGDKVSVSEGYARNFLLKKKLGVEATAASENDLKLQKANEAKVAQQKLDDAKALAAKIEAGSVTVSIKTGTEGRVFGSISSKEIAQAVKDQMKLEVDKKKIVLAEPIRSVGTSIVSIKLHPQVTAKLTVKVAEEN